MKPVFPVRIAFVRAELRLTMYDPTDFDVPVSYKDMLTHVVSNGVLLLGITGH